MKVLLYLVTDTVIVFEVYRTLIDDDIVVCLMCRYLALESMSLLATSELSHDAVKKHQDTVLSALKVKITVV